ncbi:major tail protein [Arthrobacter phage Wilde]|uniref:Major tail protein n=1 Tax=Arthrobacter phage Wilde TaxID=1772323 RepID=A0A0U4B7V6_9CAUD|nr:major tail protein [Arthrobacter phage Wilde]
MGREVAEAYINVHGDLSPFRRDLEKANEGMEKLARQNADKFSEAWGKRMAAGVDKQWNSIVDQMYSADPIDVNRLIKDFNAKDLDDAEAKIKAFLKKMSEHQKLIGENYDATKKAMLDAIKATREQQDAEEALAKDRQAWDRAHLDMMAEFDKQRQASADKRKADEKAWLRANDDFVAKFREVRKAYDESFDGMFKTEQAKRLTDDLKKMVIAIESADWSKFAKGFDTFDEMRDRINEVNKSMFEQGKISQENISRINRAAEEFIKTEMEKRKAVEDASAATKRAKEEELRLTGEALTASRKAREEAERMDKTFEGMVNKATIRKLENDFRRLTEAVASNDWSSFSKGHKDFNSMHVEINRVIGSMHSLGRMSDDSLGRINIELDMMRSGARGFQGAFQRGTDLIDMLPAKFNLGSIALSLLTRGLENFGKKLAGMSGFNVVGDMLREGSEFMQNIDRHAVSWAKNMTVGAGALSAVVSSVGGISVIGSDLAKILGGLAAFVPAFATGFGIGIGTLIAALKDMKTVLKDLGPAFSKLQDNISSTFWKIAEQPIRNLVNNTMPLLNEKLAVTSENLAGMFTEFARVLDNQETRDSAGRMFDRMNSAIKISQGMIAPLTNAFVTLADFGSLYFERFSTWLVNVSTQFNDFIQKAAADGRLQKWMDDAIQGLKDLWSIASSAVGIWGAISDAAEKAGSKGLHGFAENLAAIEKIMTSERFQAALVTVFQSAGTVMEGFKEGIKKLGPAFESALPTLAGAAFNFKGIIETAFGYLADFISNKGLQDGFLTFTTSIKTALDTLAPSIPILASGLGGLMSFMGTVLENVARIVNEVITKLSPVFDKMMEKLEPLIPVIGDLAVAFIDSLAPILETFVDEILPPLIDLIKDLAPLIADFLKQITPGVVENIKAFGEALKVIVGIIDGVTDALDSLKAGGDLEWLGTTIEALVSGPGSDASKKMGDTIAGWIKSIDVGAGLAELGRMITDGWNRIWSGNIFGDQPGKFFTDFGNNFSKGLDAIGTFLGEAWEKSPIKNWWDESVVPWFDDIKRSAEELWKGFTDFLSGLFGGGGDEGGGTGGAGSMSVGKAIGLADLEDPSKWEEFGSNVRQWVTDFFTGIGDWITETSTTLKEGWDEFWGGFGDKVSEIWNGMVEWIVTKYTEISTGITEWWTGVQEGWNAFWDGVNLKVQEIWTGIVTWVTTKYTEISTGITQWFTDVKTGWDNFWKSVSDKVTEIWNGMVTWIVTKYTEISNNISNFITTVRTNWDNFWKAVNDKVVEIWNGVKSWIDTKVTEIRTNIDNFINTVRSNWDNFWRGVGDTVSRIWQGMASAISGFVGGIIGTVSGFIGNVRGIWDGGWNGITTALQNAWNNMVTAVQTGVNNVVSFVSGLPGKILGFIQGINLSGAGAAIMNGFLGGLKSAWGGVTNFVGGIADWIAKNKGPIEYDRRLLVPAGAAIMQSLVDGLQGGMGGLENQVNNVTDQILSGVTQGLARSAMYAAGADAALGLADGLSSKAADVERVFKGLIPDVPEMRVTTGSGGVGYPTLGGGESVGASVIVENINLHSNASDEGILAEKIVDELVDVTTL